MNDDEDALVSDEWMAETGGLLKQGARRKECVSFRLAFVLGKTGKAAFTIR
jgi:hypothetical protein